MIGAVLAWLAGSRVGRYVALAGAVVIGVLLWVAGIRRQAKQEAAGDAAIQAQQTQEAANAAARDAQRDGAANRLRDGRF